jgi:hypothetical protein
MVAKIDPKVAEAIMLDHGFKPLIPYVTSNSKWESLCLKCNKVVSPRLSQVKSGVECGFCSGAIIDPADAVKLMMENDLIPLEPYKNSRSKWKCECKRCHKIVYPYHTAIKQGKGGCIYCAKGQYVNPDDAVKMMLKAGLKPLEPYKGSGLRWKCLHLSCNQIVYPMYASIQQGQGGCIHCAGIAKKSDSFARKAMLKAQLEPLEEYTNAKVRWKCKCLRCKKIVFPTYSAIQSGGSGCIYCAKGQFVDPEDAFKLMQRNGFEPLEPYSGTHKKWKSIHIKCGKIVYPQHSAIQQGNGGCRTCATSGYQYAKESYLYLITHQQFGAHKIGIANKSKVKSTDRLYRHKQEGWEVVEVWNFNDGWFVARIETRIFQILRNELGISQFLVKEQMKFGGQTETLDSSAISIPELKKLVKKVINSLAKE